MRHRKKKLSPQKAYVKAICKAMREAVGLSPATVFRNRKRYHRASEKRNIGKTEEP